MLYFPQRLHLAKHWYSVTTHILTLIQPTDVIEVPLVLRVCVCTLSCVYLAPCSERVHHSQGRDHYHHPRIPCYCFYTNTTRLCFLQDPSLTPGYRWSLLCFYNFVFSGMLYEWNNIPCNILQVFLLCFQKLGITLWRFHLENLLRMSIVCSFLLLHRFNWYDCSANCLTIYPLKDIVVVYPIWSYHD